MFCPEHIQLDWLDDDHKFVKDVEVPLPGGEVKPYKKGEYSKILWSYVENRAKCLDKRVYDRLLVWGQPKAWVDSQICVQISNELARRYGQTMVVCDCLGSRWGQHSMLAHFQNQALMVPLAPGSTAFMQEPDTHEHAQIKYFIKQVKAEHHFDIEHEAKIQNKDLAKVKWGPCQYVTITAEALKRFVEANPLCPLLGCIENQLLAIRPSRNGKHLVPVLLEDCPEAMTYIYIYI